MNAFIVFDLVDGGSLFLSLCPLFVWFSMQKNIYSFLFAYALRMSFVVAGGYILAYLAVADAG